MIGFDCICLYRDLFFMTYHPSYAQMGHFMGRETIYCNLNRNTCLRAWAVLFSLPGSAMGRETVYLCYDFRRFPKTGEIVM